MQFSEAWLRTMADPPIDSAALCHRLTMAGLEVEEARPAAAPLEGVVVAEVTAVAPHPNADRLRLCRVDAGTGEVLQIVCGAPNVEIGQKVPCALPGATLPGGLAIRVATVRGVQSSGMLCSARELELSDDASGLMLLPAAAPVGRSLREYLALDDTLITLKLTPNRPDCLSVLGIAREVSALTSAPLRRPAFDVVPPHGDRGRAIRVEEPFACPRFCARVIRGIDPTAPSPMWMRQRLERSGIRSISAVVDVTNFVMLELGQPLHAYDADLLDGDIVVRFPRSGEKLTLLNGQAIDLDPDMLLVCDQSKPLGLAGIMGGEHSGIGERTTEVFLEGAFWSPDVIQGRSRRLGFSSDAGHRFERGVDFGSTPIAVERATQLIVEICGGAAGPLIDEKADLPERPEVKVRASRIERLLGVSIPADVVADIFGRLGLHVRRAGHDFVVTPPSYRFDLDIEEDFVEEVARVYGYENIPSVPAKHVQSMGHAREAEVCIWELKDRIAARDYQEVITFSFVAAAWEADFAGNTNPIHVLNPIASHLDVMRSTLAGSLVDVLRTNVSRKQSRVRLFETGRCFLRNAQEAESFLQPMRIGGLAFGYAAPEQWATPPRPVDFFDVKGDLEAIVAPRTLTTARSAHPALHPGRSARLLVDDVDVGWLGELHPNLQRRYELPSAPVLFELDMAPLHTRAVPHALPVSKFPPVRRDIAFVVDESVSAQALLDALHAVKPDVVSTLSLFDVYRGAGVPGGKKSLAILVLMQDTERTLTDAEIEEHVNRLVRAVQEQFGAVLRK